MLLDGLGRYYVIIILLCSSGNLYAQRIDGQVFDPLQQEYIPKAIVRAVTKIGQPIGFDRTDSMGYFSIGQSIDSLPDNIMVIATAPGYLSDTIYKPPYDFELYRKDEQSIKIENIEIKAKRESFGTQRDDITSYNGKEYRDSLDGQIEHLLDNIPGISINTITGEIQYNNQEIKTVLLDNQNITNNEYRQLTQNYSQNIIDKVEIIRNYSENNALKYFEKTGEVAINIVSDTTVHNRISGTIYGGYGPKGRYDAKIDLLQIRKELQIMMPGRIQNVGDVNAETNISMTGKGSAAQDIMLLPTSLSNSFEQKSQINRQSAIMMPKVGMLNMGQQRALTPNVVYKINNAHALRLHGAAAHQNDKFLRSTEYRALNENSVSFNDQFSNLQRRKVQQLTTQYDGNISNNVQLRISGRYAAPSLERQLEGRISNRTSLLDSEYSNRYFQLAGQGAWRIADHHGIMWAASTSQQDVSDDVILASGDANFLYTPLAHDSVSSIQQNNMRSVGTQLYSFNYANKISNNQVLTYGSHYHRYNWSKSFEQNIDEVVIDNELNNFEQFWNVWLHQLQWMHVQNTFKLFCTAELALSDVALDAPRGYYFLPKIGLSKTKPLAEMRVTMGRSLHYWDNNLVNTQGELQDLGSWYQQIENLYPLSVVNRADTYLSTTIWPRSLLIKLYTQMSYQSIDRPFIEQYLTSPFYNLTTRSAIAENNLDHISIQLGQETYVYPFNWTVALDSYLSYNVTQQSYLVEEKLIDQEISNYELSARIKSIVNKHIVFSWGVQLYLFTASTTQAGQRDISDWTQYVSYANILYRRGERLQMRLHGVVNNEGQFISDFTSSYELIPRKCKLSFNCRNIFNTDRLTRFGTTINHFVNYSNHIRDRSIYLKVEYSF